MPKPFKDIKSIKRVVELREKGLSFLEIARVMQKDVKVVHRWYTYTKSPDVRMLISAIDK